MTDYGKFFSEDTYSFMRSPVRDIFKKVDLNNIYSFAGGYPSAETFPLDTIDRLSSLVIKKYGAKALQYGATQGVDVLREALSERYSRDMENIQITTSSQQGIDVCARIMINPGDVVLTLNPSYLGALQSFHSYRADIRGITYYKNIPLFENEMEKIIGQCVKEKKNIKFFYVIPDFQNPSGETLSLEERKLILSMAEKYDFLVVEDSPYKELRYEGKSVVSMHEILPERVIHLGSFSKIFAPGFRLGWIFADSSILDKIYVCKQSLDLCPPTFDQYITAEFLSCGSAEENLEKTKLLYRKKRDLLVGQLSENMPDGVTWTRPEGGLFLFLTLPDKFDSVAFYDKALSAGVAYVAGNFFYTDGSHKNTMRMNFSFMNEEKIVKGTRLLCELLKQELI